MGHIHEVADAPRMPLVGALGILANVAFLVLTELTISLKLFRTHRNSLLCEDADKVSQVFLLHPLGYTLSLSVLEHHTPER